MKQVLAGVIAVVAIVGAILVDKPAQVTVTPQSAPVINVPEPVVNVTVPKTQTLGIALSDVTSPVTFYDGVTYSNAFATTSNGAGTLTASNITGKGTILSTNSAVLTLTLPASSTLTGFIPKAGDRTRMVVVNQGTAVLTLAGGTGTFLQTASSTKAVNIGGTAILEFVRKTNTDINVFMSAGI